MVIADIPYNVGIDAYGSNPAWYVDGDNSKGESKLAGTSFFDTDKDFRITEFLHFCSKLMKKEPKQKGLSPSMIVFCEFEQQFEIIKKAKEYGINRYINLVFRKNFSAQVLKANMRIVGNAEYALLLYRDKLPKFNNNGKMIFNIIDWERDKKNALYEKIHPCLPFGEEVFFNNKWMRIEDVRIGDSNRYGKVSCTTRHYAEKLVEIICGNNKTTATWNHPFLINRADKIYWVNADQIKTSDFILTRALTIFQTCNLSHPLNTSGCTLVADLSKGNGRNHALNVESINLPPLNIGIFQGDGLTVNQERFLLQKVGSVKIIHQKTEVYNLTIDGIPAFDTRVGVSHNTQKPIKLLEKLISIFTDEGDVVIDPVAGSGSTLIAANNLNRKAYGFEIKKNFFNSAKDWIEKNKASQEEIKQFGFAKTQMNNKKQMSMFI